MELDLTSLQDLDTPNLSVLDDIPAPAINQSEEDSAMSSLLSMSLDDKVRVDSGEPQDIAASVKLGMDVQNGDQTAVDNIVQRDRKLDLQTSSEQVRQELEMALRHGSANPQALTEQVKALDDMRVGINDHASLDELHKRAIEVAETNPSVSQTLVSDLSFAKEQQNLLEALAKKDDVGIQSAKHQIKFDMATKEQKAQMEAIGVPWYEPADLIADILTIGVASAARASMKVSVGALSNAVARADAKMMAKALGVPVTHQLVTTGMKLASTNFSKEFLIGVSKWAPKGLLSGTVRDASFGMFAGGVMSVADMAYSNNTVTALSGILGPMATSALFGLTRKGMAAWMSSMANNNHKLWMQIKEAIEAQDTPLAAALKEAQRSNVTGDRIEFGVTHFTGLLKAARAAGSEGMQKELSQAIRVASVSTADSALRTTVEKATGAGPLTEIIPLLKEGTDVKIGESIEFGRNLSNATDWQKHLGDRVMWDTAMENAADDPVLQGMAAMRIYNGDQVGLGYTPTWGNGKKAAESVGDTSFLRRLVGSSSSILKSMSEALVKDPTYLLHKTNAIRKATNNAIVSIQKELSKGERKALNAFLDNLNQTDTKPVLTGNGFIVGKHFYPMSEKVIRAYAKTRTVMDFMHSQVNQAVMAQYKRNGFKYYVAHGAAVKEVPKSQSVGVIDDLGRTLTEDQYKQGFRMFESTSESQVQLRHTLNPEEIVTHVRDFRPKDRVIKYRDNYVPRIYKDEWRVWEIAKTSKGLQVRPRATAPSFKKANSALQTLNSTTGDNIEHIVLRRNETLDVSDFIATQKFSGELQTLNEKQISVLKKTLIEAGADVRTVEKVFDGVTKFSFKESSHLMSRKGVLKDWTLQNVAPLKTGLESIAEYVDTQSKYIAFADHLSAIKTKFLSDFGPYLDNNLDVFSGVKSSVTIRNPKLADGIRRAQEHMRELYGIRPTVELERQSRLMQKAKDLYLSGGRMNSIAGSGMEALTKFTDLSHLMKKVGAHAKLGMFNVSQMLVQSLAILNPVGRHLFKDGASIFSTKNAAVNGMRDAGKMIVGVGEEAKHLRSIYARSGFGMMDYANIADVTNAYSGKRRLWSGAVSMSQLPYTIGEGTQKAVAWMAERRNLINEITSGKNVDFRMKDVDSENFLREVSKRAMDLSLNMSKYNQPMFAKGWLGVPLQFAQFATHQGELMFGKNLSKAERLGLWASWVGMFGIGGGIPFLGDLIHFGETAAGEVDPRAVGKSEEYIADFARYLAKQAGSKDIDFWARLATKGSAYALTQGELDLASRAGVAKMLQNYYDGLSWSDLLGPSGETIYQIGKGGVETISDMINVFMGNAKFHAGILLNPFKEVTGVTNIASAINAGMNGELRDKNNRLIKEEPTLWEIVATGVGIRPGDIVKMQEEQYKNIKFQQITNDWMKSKAEKIARTRVNDVEFSNKMITDAIKQIAEVNPMSIRRFFSELSRELIATTVDLETRTAISSLRVLNRFTEKEGSYIEDDNEMANVFPDLNSPDFMFPEISKGTISKNDVGSDVKEMIKKHEGTYIQDGLHMPYTDTEGNSTIGYGHKILSSEVDKYRNGISEEEALSLFETDFNKHAADASEFPQFKNLPPARQKVIIDMTYNMGAGWWNKWPDLKRAAEQGDWDAVAAEMQDSKWYGQVGVRAKDLIKMWRDNG